MSVKATSTRSNSPDLYTDDELFHTPKSSPQTPQRGFHPSLLPDSELNSRRTSPSFQHWDRDFDKILAPLFPAQGPEQSIESERKYQPIVTIAYLNEIMSNKKNFLSIVAKLSCIVYPIFCSLAFFTDLILYSPKNSDLEVNPIPYEPLTTTAYFNQILSCKTSSATIAAKLSCLCIPIFCILTFSKDLFSAIVKKYTPERLKDDDFEFSNRQSYPNSVPVTPERFHTQDNPPPLDSPYNLHNLSGLNVTADSECKEDIEAQLP